MVALGANVSCMAAGDVLTTVNQALLRSNVWLKNAGASSWTNMPADNYSFTAPSIRLLQDGLVYGLNIPATPTAPEQGGIMGDC